ncbi:MAG: hypothetical protein HY518_01325 [Candidatus Aenigmarchaeota archaeon]|nr:hypothetical protein [Candidatus Aenigmarchaeota archaeon]
MNKVYSIILVFWMAGLAMTIVGMAGKVSFATTGYFISPVTAGAASTGLFSGFTLFGVSMLLAAAVVAVWHSHTHVEERQGKKYIAG